MSTIDTAVASKSVSEYLSEVVAYPEHPNSVQVIETHISWIYLTDWYAYKLKKPVRFEFLDFSTPARRHCACLEELRLNRRLAPDVYIDVLPITQDAHGTLALNGRGEEVDWLVQMQRLSEDKALDAVLRRGLLTEEDAKTIAEHLATFYSLLPAEQVAVGDYRDMLDRHIRANGHALLAAIPEEQSLIHRIQSAQLRYLHLQTQLIDNRVDSGRIVDGHGDLRPEHIYLGDPPAVIDCIEFSDELRRVDIADELSFLAMECQRLGDGSLGELVLTKYQNDCGDQVPPTLLSFYRSYRACVRAKVAVLREQQQADDQRQSSARLARTYIDWAERYAAELGPPALLIISGMIGSGKSTLAAKLAEAFAAELLSTDHIRHALLGTSPVPAGYGEGHYQPDLRRRIYDELFRKASHCLDRGLSVVLDGTFPTWALREEAYDLGFRHGAIPLYVLCTCPRETAMARIHKRVEGGESESEARAELYDLQVREFELPWADDPAITVDTTQSMPEQLHAVCRELQALLPG